MRVFFVMLWMLAAVLPLSALDRSIWDQKYADCEKHFNAGNYKNAAELGRELLTRKPNRTDHLPLGPLFSQTARSLFELGRERQYDQLLADALACYPDSPAILAAAENLPVPAYGRIVDGRFIRGRGDRGNSRSFDSSEYDRVALLRRFVAALPAVEKLPPDSEKQQFFRSLADLVLRNRDTGLRWMLQQKTDLARDPELNYPLGPYIRYAPVGGDGKPVIYPLPASFAAAQSDGERYRRALADAGLAGDERAALAWADFLDGEIGLSTLNSGDWDDRTILPGGEESIRTLGDQETLARLVDGMHRFALADQVNPLKLYQSYLERHPDDLEALERLAELRNQRCQFDRAAELLARYRKISPDNQSVNRRYRQLTAPLLEFEPRGPFAVGEKMAAKFFYRNAGPVEFELRVVDFESLWRKWREAILRPRKDGEPELTENFASDAITMLNAQIGKPDRVWRRTLEPAPGHADRKGEAELPALESGFYLLSARVKDGNRAQILFAVNGFAFWKQSLPGASRFFVTDAVSGSPVEGARLTTWRLERRYANTPAELAKYGGRVRSRWIEGQAVSDRFGQAVIPVREHDRGWTMVCSADGKTVAWAEQFFAPGSVDRENPRTRAYVIADRPIYRPGDTVELECYLRQIGYAVDDPEKGCTYRKLQVEIRSPRGAKVLDQSYTTTSFGSFAISFPTAPGAELGMYRVLVRDGRQRYGNAVFRVEEFVKPEYKVALDTPDAPVKAGSPVECAVRADYYFGGPVADAAVKVKVTRSAYYGAPFFRGAWSWLYGDWYWCCSTAWNFGEPVRTRRAPELVLQTEGRTNAEGQFKVRVDTAMLAARYGESDVNLKVEATVTDSARKPVNAAASVIVAAKPFRVYSYTTGGFFAPGETIALKVAARTPDGKPVAGRGQVRICRQVLEEGIVKRQEPALRTLELVSDGKSDFVTVSFALAESGVFAVESTLTAADGSQDSFTLPVRVVGDKLPGEEIFSELPLEISTDRAEYQAGDRARVLFNSRLATGTFFVFIHGGASPDFRVLHFNDHAEMLTLDIDREKQPNFFVEAVLVSGGKLYREQKEIVVPPEKKILQLAVEVPAPQVRPGTPGAIKLKVTDAAGQPVKGSVTVAVYDAALDAVPGAVPVPEIHRFFWGWKRYWQSLLATNLESDAFLASSEPVEALFPPFPGERFMLTDGVMAYGMAAGGGRGRMLMAAKSAGTPEAALAAPAAAPNVVAESLDRDGAAPEAELPAGLPVRSDFADRILWVARKTLDSDGSLELKLRYPDNLTTWKVKVWALADGLRVGEGETTVIVSKELIARLTMPRFLVEGDRTLVTATIHNYAAEPRNCKVTLKAPANVTILDAPKNEIAIPPLGNAVLEWKVAAGSPGPAEFTLAAISSEGGDALRESIAILPQGALQLFGMSGILDGERAENSFDIPSTARLGSARLAVNVTPSSALAMLELLPYLVGEESNNVFSIAARFAPALAAREALLKAKVPPELFGKYRGHYAELAGGRDRAEAWSEYARNPLRDNAELNRVAAGNVRMLEAFQNRDGGWGWFSSRNETSTRDTTVEAVTALLQAQSSGIAVDRAALKRAENYLVAAAAGTVALWKDRNVLPGNIDARVLLTLTRMERFQPELAQLLFEKRTEALSPFGLALLGRSFALAGKTAEVGVLLVNLEQYYQADQRNQYGYLKVPETLCYWWYGDDLMTQSAYLEFLLAAKPADPKAPVVANYIVRNLRNSPGRNSIRSLGAGVAALGAYLDVSNELAADETVEILLDGVRIRELHFAGDSIWTQENTIEISPDFLAEGRHTLGFRRSGRGRIYWAAYLSYYNHSADILPAGKELAIERVIYRVVSQQSEITVADDRARPTTAAAESIRLERLKPGEAVASGDRLEVELNVKSANDFDYVVFIDPRPAGAEPANPVSGMLPGRWDVYAEYGKIESRFYLRTLGRGENQVRYRLRAQQPGVFQALAPTATGVYASELRSNGRSEKIEIK